MAYCLVFCIGSCVSVDEDKTHVLNPLISNITLQILLSYCHTLLIAEAGIISLPKEFMLSDEILYSHEL